MPAPVIDKGIATSGLLAHVPVAKYADHLPLYRQEQIYAWAGAHPRAFLGDWRGELMCDDYGGYKACFEQGMAEVGCMAYARRRFFELHQSGKSQIAEQALKSIGQLYEIETRVASLPPRSAATIT